MNVNVNAHRSQKRVLSLLELELEMVESQPCGCWELSSGSRLEHHKLLVFPSHSLTLHTHREYGLYAPNCK